MELSDIISRLLTHADPEGEAYRRLSKMRQLVSDRVMLNPGDMKFLQSLISRTENAECRYIRDGICGKVTTPPIGRCQFVAWYKGCPSYEEQKGNVRGNPLKAISKK